MSRSTSPSANKPYGLARVCRVWRIPRATACRHQSAITAPADARAKRGRHAVFADSAYSDRARRHALRERGVIDAIATSATAARRSSSNGRSGGTRSWQGAEPESSIRSRC